MRFRKARKAILFAVMIAIAVAPVQQTAAQRPYRPDPAHADPEKVPAHLIAAVARAFQIEDVAVRNAAFVRSAGPKLMGHYTGANLNRFKADKRRSKRLVPRISRIQGHSDGCDRSRHDLRLVLQGPPRGPR